MVEFSANIFHWRFSMLVKINAVVVAHPDPTLTIVEATFVAKKGAKVVGKKFAVVVDHSRMYDEEVSTRKSNLSCILGVISKVKDTHRSTTDVVLGVNNKTLFKDLNSLCTKLPSSRSTVYKELVNVLEVITSFNSFHVVKV